MVAPPFFVSAALVLKADAGRVPITGETLEALAVTTRCARF